MFDNISMKRIKHLPTISILLGLAVGTYLPRSIKEKRAQADAQQTVTVSRRQKVQAVIGRFFDLIAVRERINTMKRILKAALILTVLILLAKYNRYIRPGIPTSIQLAQALDSNSRIEFRVPHGGNYMLVLGFQAHQAFIAFPSSCRVRIHSVVGAEVLDKRFFKNDLLNTNWLQGEGRFVCSPTIIIDGELLRLDEHLVAGGHYSISLSLPEVTATNVSLWLVYER